MKRCNWIILAGMFACLLSAGITAAQVGPDGNLVYTLSDFQTGNRTANSPETLVIRNRLDSGCTWTASAEALYMSRSGGKSSTLIQTTGGTDLLNSNGFEFPWAAGPRVGIVGEDVLCGCDVEASFFSIDGWTDTKNVVVPAEGANLMIFNQTPATTTIGLVLGEEANYHYISRLRSGEINLRHPMWERLSVLMGFRYVELHEELNSSVTDLTDQSSLSILDANVDNHLYGGQVGLNVAFINTCRFSIEGVVKAGVYCNYSDLTMSVIDLQRQNVKTTHTAALGEVGLMGIFQVTNHLSARLGYQAMWIDGIAIASDQVENFNPVATNPKPYMGGTLFYHGASAGLEYAF
jgi:hypothetical protein